MVDGRQATGRLDQGLPSTMPGTATADAAVAVSGLSKSYGGIRALVDMDLAVAAGTIHAVVGENGAGKSTLDEDPGRRRPAGRRHRSRSTGRTVAFASPQDARRAGIGIVYQELSLFPERSILANLFPDQQPTRRGLVDTRADARRRGPVLDGSAWAPTRTRSWASSTSMSGSWWRSAASSLERPRVLILDEPNSALNERETERLFAVLRDLRARRASRCSTSRTAWRRCSQIADRITVMRNGRLVLTRDRADADHRRRSSRPWSAGARASCSPRRGADPAAHDVRADVADAPAGALEVQRPDRGRRAAATSTFTARPGEIIGLAGLEGSGVATLLGVLFGTRRASGGRGALPGRRRRCRAPRPRRRGGASAWCPPTGATRA